MDAMFKWIGSKSFKSQKGNQVQIIYLARKQVDGTYEGINVFADPEPFKQAVSLGLKCGEDCVPTWEWGNRLQAIRKA